MGCRQSRDKPDELAVESLRYQKRPSKYAGRKKTSKKSTKSTNSVRSGGGGGGDNSATAPDHDRREDASLSSSHKGPADQRSFHSSTGVRTQPLPSAASSSPLQPSSTSALSKDGNNINECPRNLLDSHSHTCKSSSLNNGIPLPTDHANHNPAIEPKNGRIFPVWDSSYHEACSCVNVDSNQESPHRQEDEDRRRSSSSTVRLCRRCSQTIQTGPNNNKRGSAGSNNSSATNNNHQSSVIEEAGTTSGGGTPKMASGMREVKDMHLAAIVNLLALAALDLSAPATSVLVKNRKNAWIQLAGHPGAFAPAGPSSIWKKRIAKENYEMIAYQALSNFSKSIDIIPTFHREVEFNGEYFIEIEDLLHHFNDPSIMDIKMGTRTFLEAEVKNPVLRKDLFDKMIKLDPDAPTAEEREADAITKLRYMQFREHESSTASLGFRIEAIRMSGEPPNTNLKKVRTKEEVSYFIETFTKGHRSVIPSLRDRLRDIRHKFESIPFFNSHEIIGSSLLIMYDGSNQSNVWMIDFAKTIPIQDVTVNHRSPWQLGNHEDGYLYGLDHLIEIFEDLSIKVQGHTAGTEDACKTSS